MGTQAQRKGRGLREEEQKAQRKSREPRGRAGRSERKSREIREEEHRDQRGRAQRSEEEQGDQRGGAERTGRGRNRTSDRQGNCPIQKLFENHILFKIYIQTSKYMYLAIKISGDRGKIVVRLMIDYLIIQYLV